ncbi:hypothetical protein VTK26DRAFT_5246 [Humicola hyalothermophila]
MGIGGSTTVVEVLVCFSFIFSSFGGGCWGHLCGFSHLGRGAVDGITLGHLFGGVFPYLVLWFPPWVQDTARHTKSHPITDTSHLFTHGYTTCNHGTLTPNTNSSPSPLTLRRCVWSLVMITLDKRLRRFWSLFVIRGQESRAQSTRKLGPERIRDYSYSCHIPFRGASFCLATVEAMMFCHLRASVSQDRCVTSWPRTTWQTLLKVRNPISLSKYTNYQCL